MREMPDVNILIAAHIPTHPAHAVATRALTGMTSQPFGLSPLVLGGFVRMVTHARALKPPTSLEDALLVIHALCGHPFAAVLGPGPRHVALMSELCTSVGATGKLVADAQHAAIAVEHGCRWVTLDRDFKQFEGHGLALRTLQVGS